jgi:hypothetical protein
MAMYKCESCGRFYPEPWCDKDQRSLTTVVPDAEVPPDAMSAAIARHSAQLNPTPANAMPSKPKPAAPAAAPRPKPAPAPAAAPAPAPAERRVRDAWSEPRREPKPEPEPEPKTSSAQTSVKKTIVGLDKFVGMLNSGRKAIVICGSGQSGKSEIANAFIRAMSIYRGSSEVRTLRTLSTSTHTVGGTNPDEVWFQPAGRRHVFLDPSGEFYNALSPQNRLRLALSDISDEDLNFLRPAIGRLAGLVLVFDLTKVASDADHSLWQQQEDEFNFFLAAIRWLRFRRRRDRIDDGMTNAIAAQFAKKPKLDIPILVLFSKADVVDADYTYQHPLAFARGYLPTLHGALTTHARWFRFDFCHTMERTGSGDRAVDRPVGVLLAMEWLLESRRWFPRLPTTILGGGR